MRINRVSVITIVWTSEVRMMMLVVSSKIDHSDQVGRETVEYIYAFSLSTHGCSLKTTAEKEATKLN